MLSERLDEVIHDLVDLPRHPVRAAELKIQRAIQRLHELREASKHTDLVAKGNGVGAATLAIAVALGRKGVRPAADLLPSDSEPQG